MMDLDFAIITLPRSGSHMLASALDSHPDICCRGEIFRDPPLYEWLGTGNGIKGGIVWPGNFTQVKTRKVIALTRDPLAMARSLMHTLPDGRDHAIEPSQAIASDPGEKRIDAMQRRHAALMNLIAQLPDALTLTYESLTENRDVREIPAEISMSICDFLEVSQYQLVPRTFKPNVTHTIGDL